MPYIYKITNCYNGKVYIGKTSRTVQQRWQEHCRERLRHIDRPLYRAINKYGIDLFSIEEIEKVDSDEMACEREKYWIEYYGSFKVGYNATVGGDGKSYVDYDKIEGLYHQGKTIKEVASILKYDRKTVQKVVDILGFSKEFRAKRRIESISKMVVMKNKTNNEILEVFESIEAAYRYLNKQSSGHIAAVCAGKRQSAYGYKWEYL